MVQGADGRWSSRKPNYSEVNITFEDGHVMRSPLCKKCLTNVNFEKIMEAIVDKNSKAAPKSTRDSLSEKTPISFEEIR